MSLNFKYVNLDPKVPKLFTFGKKVKQSFSKSPLVKQGDSSLHQKFDLNFSGFSNNGAGNKSVLNPLNPIDQSNLNSFVGNGIDLSPINFNPQDGSDNSPDKKKDDLNATANLLINSKNKNNMNNFSFDFGNANNPINSNNYQGADDDKENKNDETDIFDLKITYGKSKVNNFTNPFDSFKKDQDEDEKE